MFKYDNKIKNSTINKIKEYLNRSSKFIISEQSAARIEYLIKQRQLLIDSVEVDGTETVTGRPLRLILDIKNLVHAINQ